MSDATPLTTRPAGRGGNSTRRGEWNDLVARLRAGDRAAADTLFVSIIAFAFALGRANGLQAADAENLAQDVAVRTLEHLRRFDPARGSARGWVAVIARRLLIDVFRRRKSFAPMPADAGAGVEDPHEALERREAGERLRAELVRLDAAHREPIVLLLGVGMMYRQIADATATPLGTIASRVARAKAILRTRLRDDV